MRIQAGLGNEKNKRIQSKKNCINKLRDRNEHMIMDSKKTNIVGAKLDIIN